MNLKDLNKIDINDLKNIDWESAKDRLLSQPGLIINILIIGVTVFIVVNVFRVQAGKAKTINTEMAELQKKTKALNKLEKTQKQYDKFLNNVPDKISEDQLIEKLSEFALKWNVQILSFSPAQEKSTKHIGLTNVKIDIRSEDYANIILFMHEIEKSSYLIRIGGLSGKGFTEESSYTSTRSRRSRRQQTSQTIEPSKEFVQAIIEIESVEFKNG